ncbi:hypothetical protein KUV85_06835 [Nocardioides panacisoli]|uniref:hypothetical protein n=1 Tax=Nocardioides panacisoli TaxID=627624 RepID=UPI001C63747D|nr:hypothetical protein [Nocardioides panacisoli]QYJ05389.1 hypothetical protein KUV85_06835 [Nocardioides panacisoli]
MLQDALAQATAAFWERRAADFEAAKPDPARDFLGRATVEELREQWRRCDANAHACRAHALLWRDDPGQVAKAEVDAAIEEVAA